MDKAPQIRTAIPQRRYRVGEYTATLLGDIESGDGIEYRFILAFVGDGRSRPSCYVCAERNSPGERSGGQYRLRLVNEAMSEVLGSDDGWRELETFATEGLRIGGRSLGLAKEQAVQVL